MQFRFFFTLILIALAVVFALQNSAVVSVNFLVWNIESSLSLVLLLTFLVGVVSGLLAVATSRVRRHFTDRRQRGNGTPGDAHDGGDGGD